MKISQIGEFGLIAMLQNLIEADKAQIDPHLIFGVGDDAAAWQSDAGVNLATIDCLVQDVHFKLDKTSWRELGWKALAVSLSDIAAMGGVPKYALFSLALPEETNVEDVAELYKGILELAHRFKVKVIGGNISRAPILFIDSVVYGITVKPNIMLTRSTAKLGEEIAVTGYLGAAAGGLKIIKDALPFAEKIKIPLLKAFNTPFPRIEEGQKLAAGGVKCAMDISDGLTADLGHICEASRVSAIINPDAVPVHPVVKTAFSEGALDMAVSGGEDYELLFTAEGDIIEELKKQMDCPVTVIGKIIAGDVHRVSLLDDSGKSYKPSVKGWNHFGK